MPTVQGPPSSLDQQPAAGGARRLEQLEGQPRRAVPPPLAGVGRLPQPALTRTTLKIGSGKKRTAVIAPRTTTCGATA